MIDQVAIGASVSLTPVEADGLAGNGPVRLVTCPNGRVIGGVGAVGMIEHLTDTDLQAFVDDVKVKRSALSALALESLPDNPRATLYTFTRI